MPTPTNAALGTYPDLRVLPARDLRYDAVPIQHLPHQVLRFTATAWNAGEGPLELHGVSPGERTEVFQRVYQGDGGFSDHPVGAFVLHPAHNHWHFEGFADYELWPRAEYDQWQASGRQEGRPRWTGSKTTGGEGFCIRDSARYRQLEGTPPDRTYRECGQEIQGMSVGYADVYKYDLPDQWIDLGSQRLDDGEYVLRVVADARNVLLESADGANTARESPEANESLTFFRVRGDRISTLREPSPRSPS